MSSVYLRLAVERGAAPRHAALERLLAVASAPHTIGDWRRDAQSLLAPHQVPVEAARLALLGGVQVPASGSVLLAAPLHLQATMSSVRLPPGGLLSLSAAESSDLAHGFNERLGQADQRLVATPEGGLLLWLAQSVEIESEDPAGLEGHDLRDFQPRGADASRLLRWASEAQLWLFDQPLNQARVRRGELPVTGLWPWGAGESNRPASPPAFAIEGRDPVFDPWRPVLAKPEDPVLIIGAPGGEAGAIDAAVSHARSALRRGGALHVSAGRRRCSIHRAPRRWFASPGRPWWEYFDERD